MRSPAANAESRLSLWLRVRGYAVPPSMIQTATERRRVGDWAGACAAARVDVDLSLRAVTDRHGREVAARLRSDLRHLAPDLLRWHLPRVAPDGLLRPGLTVSLARYGPAGGAGAVHLVARTPPSWADAGQRISLAVWSGPGDDVRAHPHPRPDRRYRLDLHRHLWDARRAPELRTRSGADRPADEAPAFGPTVPPRGYAVHRWPDEAARLLRTEDPAGRAVSVRLGPRRRLLLAADGAGGWTARPVRPGRVAEVPALPDAATWTSPDLDLLRHGLIEAERLHPLVASALAPESRPVPAVAGPPADPPGLVTCRGARHRIALVDGVLTPLDHDPAEIRREELLAALTGTPLPCLRAVDEAHRRPGSLPEIRARLDHGDLAGAVATVEALLGPDALLRPGDLRTELETAALRRITHGLFRAGLAGHCPPPSARDRRRTAPARRSRARHAHAR
ncbi:hypothetical protein ACN27B_19450 [Micromonospora sp. WMMD754]|uniref:hypothetical protein n=1 Tax=Micromonospora sp. WMMD754 TaxID=3404114 RepID=UPI003BF57219